MKNAALIVLAGVKITRGWDWVRRADGRVTLSDYANLLRHLGTARDRYRLFRRARRFVAAGGVVIAERYPIPANYFLAGPSADQVGLSISDAGAQAPAGPWVATPLSTAI